ncbi:MAG: prenyltransferase/squalene oxidase repeat-containing protein [Planctomycetota bacterium]
MRRGLSFIEDLQDETGRFGRSMYDHAICAQAVAEVYAMTGSARWKALSQKGIDFCEAARTPGSGWGYEPRSKAPNASVTAWMLTTLKVGKAAGLRVDQASFPDVRKLLDAATDEYGRTMLRPGPAGETVGAPPFPPASKTALTAAGALLRIFTGQNPHKTKAIAKGIEILLIYHPEWGVEERTDLCTWYFGTLVVFQCGGLAWKSWNQAMRLAVLEHQEKDGSWTPIGPHADVLGRVGATALMTATAEVYYRYARIFGTR